jgi:hypothetical protein
VNLSLVLQYTLQVVDEGFGWISQIDIDDDSETCYVEQKFNLDKFPDPESVPRSSLQDLRNGRNEMLSI